MQAQRIDHLFSGFTFMKSSNEIITAANNKIAHLQGKIEKRETSLKKLKSDHGVDDATMTNILLAMRQQAGAQSYTVNKMNNGRVTDEQVTVSAGVINNILTEQDGILADKASLEKLQVIARNLKDLPDKDGKFYGHQLDYNELVYLGF